MLQNDSSTLPQDEIDNQKIESQNDVNHAQEAPLEHEALNRVYGAFLDMLVLDDNHKTALRKRGLPDQQIVDFGYKSLPTFERKEIARKLVDLCGPEICIKTPGFYLSDGSWGFSGLPGLAIPVRNFEGLIVALKLRNENNSGSSRYTYFSSKKWKGGSGPAAEVHVPLQKNGGASEVRLTEGELKSDVAAVLGGLLTVSIPGVQSWRKAPSVLKSLGVSKVRIAFDMDSFQNRDVARAVVNATKQLVGDGFEVVIETWDPSYKGIDDALQAGATIQMHSGAEAEIVLTKMREVASITDSTKTNTGPTPGQEKDQPSNSDAGSTEDQANPNEPLYEIASGCEVMAKLLDLSASGEHMTNSERLRLAQIAIGADMPNDVIANLFSKQANFSPEKTHSAIRSLRNGFRLPSCKRISEDLGICDGKCPARRAASGWSPNHLLIKDEKKVLPNIIINNRQIRAVIKDAWKAVHVANEPEPNLFNRLGCTVRLVDRKESLQIEMLGPTEMFGHLARSANWLKETKDDILPTKPDTQVASDMVVNPDDRLPPLEFVITTPTYGPNGSLISEPGYHISESLYLDGKRMLEVPVIAEKPNRSKVKAAVDLLLKELLIDFPFVSPADKAHAVGALILYFVRRLIPGSTPIHGIEAPTPGSGKSLLVKLLTIIATGRSPDFHTMPNNDEEMRKKITSELMKGPQTFLFDNAPTTMTIDSPSLAAALTADPWSDRVLGASRTVSVPNKAVWVLTCNNPKLSTEMARRYVRVRLDSKQDKPWERDTKKFHHPDIISWTQENRAALVHAVLTCVQAWIAEGRPEPSVTPLGGFEAWSNVIGGILEVIGLEGFLGNRNDLYESADVEGQAWREFISVWWEQHQSAAKPPGELNQLCEKFDLMTSLRGSGSPKAQQTSLGKALFNAKDRVFGKFRMTLAADKGSHGKRYQLVPLAAGPTPSGEPNQDQRTSSPPGSQPEFDRSSEGYDLHDNIEDLTATTQPSDRGSDDKTQSLWDELASESGPDGDAQIGSQGSQHPVNTENESVLCGEPQSTETGGTSSQISMSARSPEQSKTNLSKEVFDAI